MHDKVRISGENLAGRLSGEKRLLEREVERLVAGKVLNGRDKGTPMPAPCESTVYVGSEMQM